MFNSFMLPMLKQEPLKRATAREMLFNEWLKMPPNYNFKYTD